MTIEELERYVDHEIQWLRYYAFSDSRKALNEKSDLYKDLVSIGYTKRVMSLDKRCAGAIIKTKTGSPINKDSSLDDMIIIAEPRNHSENKFTPLEVYWQIFPDKRRTIIEKLNS